VTRGARVLQEYAPAAGALKLAVYEPALDVVVLRTVTQLAPDLRWTHTGREYTPGRSPVTLTVSAAIAVEGVSRM
jgi:hypothetical protein